ncbi:MAG: hypothetical protein WB793_01550 [Candidatus Dormiibacterota bacterium]
MTAAAISARLVQNFHATTVDAGDTNTHHSKGRIPEPMRRNTSLGLMKAAGDALGRPPAIQVAAVSATHGTNQSAIRTATAPISRHACDRYRGAADMSQLTVRHLAGPARDSARRMAHAIVETVVQPA